MIETDLDPATATIFVAATHSDAATAERLARVATRMVVAATALSGTQDEARPQPETERLAQATQAIADIQQRFARRIAAADTIVELERLQALMQLELQVAQERVSARQAELDDAISQSAAASPDPAASPQFELTGPPKAVLIESGGRSETKSRGGGVIALSTTMGLLGGAGLSLVAERLDRRLYTEFAIRNAFGYPILANLTPASKRKSAESALNVVAAAVLGQVASAASPAVVAVTSADSSEARTAFITRLQAALAHAGADVQVASASPSTSNEEAADTSAFLLVDTPSLLTEPSAARSLARATCVIVVAERGSALRDEAQQLSSGLRFLDAPVLGVVILPEDLRADQSNP